MQLSTRPLRSAPDRCSFVIPVLLAALGTAPQANMTQAQDSPSPDEPRTQIVRAIRGAQRLAGLEFTDADVELMLPDVMESLAAFERMRAVSLDNAVAPALVFSALAPPPPIAAEQGGDRFDVPLQAARRPEDLSDLYWADIPTLAALIRSRQVSCLELTDLFLARLEALDPTLACVITLTPERARKQAAALDAELEGGHWRGPLHGIPWGAKDLLAVEGYPTTWGARPYAEQTLRGNAAVVTALDEAGAILVAKLSLGALAWGDVWFGGTTKNPWKPSQGSSGSSAGPASAVAAGAVPFAIGSETLGSIISPSERCGNSSLRPTFGRVPRTGAMALSWSMDKLGPICRSIEDAAVVFHAIEGRDAGDSSSLDAPFRYPALLGSMTVGFLEQAAEDDPGYAQVLEDLEALGAATEGLEIQLVPVEVPDYPAGDMTMILQVEAAAAFDELTRSRGTDVMVRQERWAWPNVFRHAHLVPAVEYVRANRLRTLLQEDWGRLMKDLDAIVHPSFAGGILQATNLTGHPTVVMPAGFREDGTPFGVSFTGRTFEDDRLMTLASLWQGFTEHHHRHPDL